MENDLAKSLDKPNHTIQKLTNRCKDCWYYIPEWNECMRPDGNGDYSRMEMEPEDFCSRFYCPDWYLTTDKGGV